MNSTAIVLVQCLQLLLLFLLSRDESHHETMLTTHLTLIQSETKIYEILIAKNFFLFGVTYTHESLKIKQRTCISTCHDDFNKLLLPCTFLLCGVMVMTHGFSIQVLYHNNLNLYQTVNDIDFQQSNVACVLCGVIVMFLFFKSGTAVQCYGNDTGF